MYNPIHRFNQRIQSLGKDPAETLPETMGKTMRFTQFSIVVTTILASQVFTTGKPTGKPRENSNSQLLGCRGNDEAAEEASRKKKDRSGGW